MYLLLCTPYFDNFSLDSARQYLAIQNKKDERKTNLTLGRQHSYPGHTHTLLAITFLIYIHIYREWKKKTPIRFISFALFLFQASSRLLLSVVVLCMSLVREKTAQIRWLQR